MKIKPYNSPYSVYINLTNKCNLRCSHCYGAYGMPQEKELNLIEWKKVIDELIKNNVFYINISGGEPTQSPFFKEFIEYCSRVGMYFILTTNGLFSKETRSVILANKTHLIGLKISLDGHNKETHSLIRQNIKSFDATMKNIKFFKRFKIPLTIATVLHSGNISTINKMMRLIKKINPISWFVSPIAHMGRAESNYKKLNDYYSFYDLKFWNDLEKKANKNKINIRFVDLPVTENDKKKNYYTCSGAINFCEIDSNGLVTPCALAKVSIPKSVINFDNIKDKSLSKIWNGKSFNKFRSYMNRGCDGCKSLSRCNKCVAQSFKYFKNGYSPTPFCVRNHKNLKLTKHKLYKKVLSNRFDISK
jgi:AdoMet-dependent heme synthase